MIELSVRTGSTWKTRRQAVAEVAHTFCEFLKQAGNQTKYDQYGSHQYADPDLVQMDHMTIITLLSDGGKPRLQHGGEDTATPGATNGEGVLDGSVD